MSRLRSAASSYPFIVHSASSASESVALPFSTTLVGPVVFIPLSSKPELLTSSLYLSNNFTGVDRLDVSGSDQLVLGDLLSDVQTNMGASVFVCVRVLTFCGFVFVLVASHRRFVCRRGRRGCSCCPCALTP